MKEGGYRTAVAGKWQLLGPSTTTSLPGEGDVAGENRFR
ncbi:MAG: hypothetical protein Ct9H300mP1_18830 [Planctomycetaceae bacterium]|nr:MAG: hypothetical protein Ct9H300mP1_18830 [Planctomycetaceae bacterium]